MAGLQPPVLQKVFQFHVHLGEFVQIVHVRNKHWSVVSTVGCESGVIHVYDSLYKSVSREALRLIVSMVCSQSSELKITRMDVEKQSNGLNPCNVRFDQNEIRQHLATCLEICQASHFPVLGERNCLPKKPKTVELHCSVACQKRKANLIWQSVIPATSGIITTAWTFPVVCLINMRFTGSVKSVPTVCEYTYTKLVSLVDKPACVPRSSLNCVTF